LLYIAAYAFIRIDVCKRACVRACLLAWTHACVNIAFPKTA